MTPLDGFHLPGLEEGDVARWDVRAHGPAAVPLRHPVLEPRALLRLAERLRAARTAYLADLPVARIVAAIDAAAARLAGDDDPTRQLAERLLPELTGYSPPMVRLVLERMLLDWRADALERLLAAEFPDPGVLDAFRPHPAGIPRTWVRALGAELALHVFSGNVPGVAVTSIIRSLLTKSAVIGKTASGEPLLPVLFARTLADIDPRLGDCLAILYWPGGSEEIETAACEAADLVVVYGGEDAVRQLRGRIPPDTRVVVHGPRFSIGLVGRDALTEEGARHTALRVARATAIFDQQGCVSPHLVYAENGEVSVEEFARLVAEELRFLQEELPRGGISAAEAATIHQLRAAGEFRELAGAGTRVFAGEGTSFTVVYEPRPGFEPSCLNRFLTIKPVDDLSDAIQQLRPVASRLQSVGIAGANGRLAGIAELLGRLGASRITTFDALPWPPPSWHHDGQPPLAELVRWADLED